MPQLFPKKSKTKQYHDGNVTLVSHLINASSHTWNEDALIEIFERPDVEKKILAIPLSIFYRED